MADFGEQSDAAAAIASVLASHTWATSQYPGVTAMSAHTEHQYYWACAVCQGDVAAIARVAVDAAYPHIAAAVYRQVGDELVTDHPALATACYQRATQYEQDAADDTTDHDGETTT